MELSDFTIRCEILRPTAARKAAFVNLSGVKFMKNAYVAKLLSAVAASRRGATAIEYGLIAALVAVAIVTGVTAVGTDLNNTFTNVSNKL